VCNIINIIINDINVLMCNNDINNENINENNVCNVMCIIINDINVY